MIGYCRTPNSDLQKCPPCLALQKSVIQPHKMYTCSSLWSTCGNYFIMTWIPVIQAHNITSQRTGSGSWGYTNPDFSPRVTSYARSVAEIHRFVTVVTKVFPPDNSEAEWGFTGHFLVLPNSQRRRFSLNWGSLHGAMDTRFNWSRRVFSHKKHNGIKFID